MKYNIMFVDDNKFIREYFENEFKKQFQDKYEVFIAGSPEEADPVMLEHAHELDCVILDIRLGEDKILGIDLARGYKELNPGMAIILLTSYPQDQYRYAIGIVDDCLTKEIRLGSLDKAIENTIRLKKMPLELRLKRFEVLHKLLPHMTALQYVQRFGGDAGAELMDGILKADGHGIIWDIYNFNQIRNIVCLASSAGGCQGGCIFCGSSALHYIRRLTEDEMIAQFMHAMYSYHLVELFQHPEKFQLDVNWSNQGDVLRWNLDAGCNVVRRLSSLVIGQKKLVSSFIFTTTGDAKGLKRLIKEYPDLPIKIHFSQNFADEKQRASYMPSAKGISLDEIRDLLWEWAELKGENQTFSNFVAKGINDTSEEAERNFKRWGKGPFDSKLMALQPCSLEGVPDATLEDAERVRQLQIRAGFLPERVRVREIKGWELGTGCGKNVSRRRRGEDAKGGGFNFRFRSGAGEVARKP